MKGRDIAALISLALLSALPFLIRISMGGTALSSPLEHDVGLQWIPFRAYIAQNLAAGYFPLWCDEIFGGFPFAAFSHTSVFYPLAALLHLGEYARAVNLFYPAHLFLAAAGAYLLCRKLSISTVSAWLCSSSYVFCGKPYYFIHFLPSTCSNVWVPWALLGVVGLIRTPRALYFFITCCAFSLELLGGDVESTSYALLFSIPFVLLMGGANRFKPGRLLLVVGALVLGGLIALVQVAPLAELSNLFVRNQGVTFEYFSRRRIPVSLFWTLLFPIAGDAGGGAVFGRPYFYLGAVPLALGLTAAFRRASSTSRVLAVLALFALLWSFGSLPFMDRLQYVIPVLGRFGSPEHAFFMAQLFLAILAGQGLDLVLSGGRGAFRLAVWLALGLIVFRLAFVSLGVSFLEVSWLTLLIVPAWLGYRVLIWRRGISFGPGLAAGWLLAIFMADVYLLAVYYLPLSDPSRFGQPHWMQDLAGPVSRSDSRSIIVTRMGVSDPDLLYNSGLTLGMGAIDGWITTPLRDYAEVLQLADPRAVGFRDGRLDRLGLNSEMRDGRFISSRSMPILNLLSLRWVIDRGLPLKFSSPGLLDLGHPDFYRRALWGRDHPEGFTGPPGFKSSQEQAYMIPLGSILQYRLHVIEGDRLSLTSLGCIHGRAPPVSCGLAVTARAGDTTDLLLESHETSRQVRRLLRPSPWFIDLEPYKGRTIELTLSVSGPPGRDDARLGVMSMSVNNAGKPLQAALVLPTARGDITLYQNRQAFARAFVVHDYFVSVDRGEVLSWLGQAGSYELSRKVSLARDPVPWLGPGGMSLGMGPDREFAFPAEREPGERAYKVGSKGPGMLFISDQYYPGWRAFVRGREAPIIRADHAFRAIPVPGGESLVRVVFEPLSFRLGLWVSLVSALVLVLVSLLWLVKKNEGWQARFRSG